jgi:hypothetical protein
VAETQSAGAGGVAAAASRALVRDVVDETREEAAAMAATDEALLAEEARRLLKTRALAAKAALAVADGSANGRPYVAMSLGAPQAVTRLSLAAYYGDEQRRVRRLCEWLEIEPAAGRRVPTGLRERRRQRWHALVHVLTHEFGVI